MLNDKLESVIEKSEVANRREGLFGMIISDFSEFKKIKTEFWPFNAMWNLAREYFYYHETWMNGVLGDIDREQLTSNVNNACLTLMKLEKIEFREFEITSEIALKLRKLYEGFKPYLPLIWDLRNPGLKQRHWKIIREKMDFEIDGELHISLQELIDLGIMDCKEIINEVSDSATREAKLE